VKFLNEERQLNSCLLNVNPQTHNTRNGIMKVKISKKYDLNKLKLLINKRKSVKNSLFLYKHEKDQVL